MSRDHIFVRCEDCRNHGKCKLANAIEGTTDKDNQD